MSNKKSNTGLAFIAVSVFSLWRLSVDPSEGTYLLVAVLYFCFMARLWFVRTRKQAVSAGTHPPVQSNDRSQFPVAPSTGDNPSASSKISKMAPDEEFVTLRETAKTEAPSPRFTIDFSTSGFDKPVKGPKAAECWVPEGRSVKVRRYVIPGGLFYLGTGLRSVTGHGHEPGLVNPDLKVGTNDDYTVRQLNYFPRYDEASEDARAAFLNWLAKGRRDPAADLGYVYLFYYGLERRAFIDAALDPGAASEIPGICAEVAALLSVYGQNYAFAARAQSFLQVCNAKMLAERRLYLESPEAYPLQKDNGFAHRLALSQAVHDGHPLPMDWWFSWLRYSLPRTKPFVSPFFRRLYEFELPLVFPNGIVEKFKPGSADRLSVEHEFVYPGLESKRAKADFGIPDFTSEKGRVAGLLSAFGHKIGEKLEAHTRLASRSPQKAEAVEGMLLLPVSLWPEQARNTFEQKALELRGPNPILDATPLSSLLQPMTLSEKLERPVYLNFIDRLVNDYGVSVEPDPRFGSALPGWESSIVLFTLRGKESPSEATEAYLRKAAEVWFYSVLARADGEVFEPEVTQAEAFIARMKGTESQRTRLRAALRANLAQPLMMSGMKKRIDLLEPADKPRIASNLVLMCQANGGLTNVANIRVLEKLFQALDQDPEGLYSMAHAGVASRVPDSTSRKTGKSAPAGFALDLSKIESLRAETTEVGEVLGAIFAEDTTTSPAAIAAPIAPTTEKAESVAFSEPSQPASPADAGAFLCLDAPHSALARELMVQQTWSRADVEQKCSALGLMLEAALERINDAAFDVAGDALFEGDDEIVRNDYVAKELSA